MKSFLKKVLRIILDWWAGLIPIAVIFIASGLILVSAKWFPNVHEALHKLFNFTEASAWGQAGDFFGGILNPIIAFCTLVVAVRVWRLQKIELKETREAIKQQTFDQFFMSMLASHRSMVEQVVFINGANQYSGKNAIDEHSASLTGHVNFINSIFSPVVGTAATTASGLQSVKSALAAQPQIIRRPHDDAIPRFSYFFTQYYNTHLLLENGPPLSQKSGVNFEQLFGHIFRSTYQILKNIDEQFLNDNKSKKRYVNLLRAQMSESEFVFFALSALTKDGEKSWARSIRLNFFENRLQNLAWTKRLADSFAATDKNIIEAEKILESE